MTSPPRSSPCLTAVTPFVVFLVSHLALLVAITPVASATTATIPNTALSLTRPVAAPFHLPPGLPAAVQRQAIDGDGYGGAGYTVRPLLRNEEPATAILVHGLGGSGEEWGFVSLAFSFFSLNYVKFIMPSAPKRYVTYLKEELPSWFDIIRLDDRSSDVNEPELLEAVARVSDIVAGEIAAGVSPNRIFLIGFSQGGAVALTAFLRARQSLAGCVGVATWIPLLNAYPSALSTEVRNRKVLMIHGTDDKAVSISQAVDAVNGINEFGKTINLTADINRLEGQGHVLVTPAVMESMETYIQTRAPGTSRYLLKLVADLTESFDGINRQFDKSWLLRTVLLRR